MNAKQFVNRHHIKATSVMVDRNPNMPDFDGDHYKVTLHMGRRQMTLAYSHGRAICKDPTADDVLDTLASDAATIENTNSFEDFCAELGYDTDSRSAERTYKATQRQTEHLQRFLGADLYDQLLWHTERS